MGCVRAGDTAQEAGQGGCAPHAHGLPGSPPSLGRAPGSTPGSGKASQASCLAQPPVTNAIVGKRSADRAKQYARKTTGCPPAAALSPVPRAAAPLLGHAIALSAPPCVPSRRLTLCQNEESSTQLACHRALCNAQQ